MPQYCCRFTHVRCYPHADLPLSEDSIVDSADPALLGAARGGPSWDTGCTRGRGTRAFHGARGDSPARGSRRLARSAHGSKISHHGINMAGPRTAARLPGLSQSAMVEGGSLNLIRGYETASRKGTGRANFFSGASRGKTV